MIKKNLSHFLNPAGIVLSLIIILFLPATVRADGCFVAPPFVWDKHKDINEPTQKAILVYDAGQEDLILQVKYNGPVKEFGWLIPVPGLPTVQEGSMECFYELSRYTQERWESPSSGQRGKAKLLGGDSEPPPPVKVIEIKTVGAYEVAVLSARDAGSLENWLNTNRFSFPKDKAAVIDSYIKQQWYFIAVKVNLDEGIWGLITSRLKLASGELHPLQISFPSDQCVFPLKISSVNGTPSEVQVYVLSSEPLVEKTMFEKKFPEVRRLALENNARRIQAYQREQERAMLSEAGGIGWLMVETNIPMNRILKESVSYEALLPFATVTGKEFPECSRKIPRLQGKTWWLTKQTWTFKPEEMRDLVFQPAVAAFVEDLATKAGYYVAQNLVQLATQEHFARNPVQLKSQAVPALLLALQSTNPIVRIHAASTLTRWGGPSLTALDSRVSDYLPVLYNDPEAEVRADAVAATGFNGNPKSQKLLIHLLRDEDERVRRAAASALEYRYYSGAPEDLPFCEKLLKAENLEIRAGAIEALAGLEVPIAREDVGPLLNSTNLWVVNVALSWLERDGLSYDDLAPLLHSDLMKKRLIGLWTLRLLDNKESPEVIIPLLCDPEQPVRDRAWRLLKTFTGQAIPEDQPDRWAQWWTKNKSTLMLADYNKAIKADPKNGGAYHNRGCFYYNDQKFPEALADFRKAVELSSEVRGYSFFRIWIIRARSGEKEAATKELATYLDSRKPGKSDDWPSKVGRFLAGQLPETDLLQAADDPKARTDREQHCEADFYAGSVRLIEGDKVAATDYFRKCRATNVKTFEEYQSAGAELKFLETAK